MRGTAAWAGGRAARSARPAPPPLPWADVNARESQEVAARIGLPRRPRGERRKWGCPVCGSSDALHAYPGPGAGYGCWAACGAAAPGLCRGYSNVDVASAHWGVPPREGCRLLAALLGISFDDRATPGAPPLRPPPPAQRPSRQETHLAALARLPGARPPPEVYADVLARLRLTARGARYLAGRALDPARAGLHGYRSLDGPVGWDSLADHLRRAYRPEELAAAGFPYDEETDGALYLPFGGRLPALLIPYRRRGEVVGLRARSLLPGHPRHRRVRYRSLVAAKPPWPYHADALESPVVHVCEGELDAETLRQQGVAACGVSGAGVWLDAWTEALAGAARVVAWHDTRDDAGEAGARALRRRLAARFGEPWVARRWRRVRAPADPNDLHRAGCLREWLAAARDGEGGVPG